MRILILLLFSFGLSGEMDVQGGLTVSEGVTASTFAGNGSGLTGIGMKPERIYSLPVNYNNEGSNFIVPNGKVWRLTGSSSLFTIDILGTPNVQADISNKSDVWLFQNNEFSIVHASENLMIIFEYPISGSGTSQGMNYVEP